MEEKGEICFGNFNCIYKESKSKDKSGGKTLNLLTLLMAISKCLAERISIEKGVGIEKAENIIVDCIKDGMKTVEE